MKFVSRRNAWLLWFAAVALLMALALFPVSYRVTRLAGVLLFAGTWCGLIALLWRRTVVRFLLLGATAAVAVFLCLPARGATDAGLLRGEYVRCLRNYKGVKYYWGGESRRGIDCSGLVRRGLIDAMLRRSLRTGDGALARQAIRLWWYDTTAEALGEEGALQTKRVTSTESVNELDAAQVQVGDLAITTSGIHIMAYLGGNEWIEADPADGRVIIVKPPSESVWFKTPMNISRWRVLE